MTWMMDLYNVYELNSSLVGRTIRENNRHSTLLPISHTQRKTHLEITIDQQGNFFSATVLDNEQTIIPVYEDSDNRSGKLVAAHGLHDYIGYVAGDLPKFIDTSNEKFMSYENRLSKWVNSQYTSPTIKTIHTYISKATLIQDLVNIDIISLDENEKLILKWKKSFGDKPQLYGLVTPPQGIDYAFVRFKVLYLEPWNDKELINLFISYHASKMKNLDVCFITGMIAPTGRVHPKNIRYPGDKAKLLPTIAKERMSYGMFKDPENVFNVSYEASQKAHNALKWLIQKQGINIGGRVFLQWCTDGDNLPSYLDDSYDILNKFGGKNIGSCLDNLILNAKDDKELKVVVFVIDAATEGRLSIISYLKLTKIDYLKALKRWHTTCSWEHVKYIDSEFVKFIGAPSLTDISKAAFGFNAPEVIIKETVTSLMQCVLHGSKVQKTIASKLEASSSNPVSMEKWQWEKTLSITCAVIEYNREGGKSLAL